MGHPSGKTYFEDGREAIQVAKKNHCRIEYCDGDHVKIYPTDPRYDPIVSVNRPLGRGLGCRLWKAFKLAGLLAFAGLVVLGGLLRLAGIG